MNCLFLFSFPSTALHIVFCLIDTLYIPYGILYYVNRVYFTCLITPNIDGVSVSFVRERVPSNRTGS